MKKMKKKVLFIIIPLLILIGGAAGAYFYVNSKIQAPKGPEEIFENPKEQKEAQIEEEKGLINILLVGVDARPGEKTGRTDSIILATIDTNNKKIKLTSFMRDMYVPIPGHGNNKINAAYAIGGPELLIKTINQDFNLNIQYFTSIDFSGFQDVVEKLGGIDVEVKDYEVNEINKYIYEANGSNATLLKGPGYQHLNGQQALSYSRIRKVGNNDYERTERQRRVISLLIEKAKKTNLAKLPDLFSTILPYVKTNVPTNKLLSLAYTVYKFGNLSIEDIRLPANGMFQSMDVPGAGSSLVPDLDKNIAYLERFIYTSSGSSAANMPAYMVNNFHSRDISLDKRGTKKPAPVIVIPKPKPGEVIPTEEDEAPITEVDKTAPTAPVITLEPGDKVVKVTIGGGTDNVKITGYDYSLDGITWKVYSAPFNVAQEGKVHARAKDAAGNVSPVSSKDVKFEKPTEPDTTDPTVGPSITLKEKGKEVEVIIAGGKDDVAIASYVYSIDNKVTWITYKGPFMVSKNLTIYAIAKDAAGNKSPITSKEVKIDEQTTTPPPVTP